MKTVHVVALGFALSLAACSEQLPTQAAPEGSYADTAKATACKFGPGTCALDAANHRMHADMAVEWTDNPDVDFLRTMIPHHVGAVEMAQAVINHGTDPAVRELAETIVRTQEEEIAQMKALLTALDPTPQQPPTAKTSHHNH